MSGAVVEVAGLSKKYRLGAIGARTFRDDFNRWWHRVRGKPDPCALVGESAASGIAGGEIWALRDVSFQVRQGEVLGIIGKNGAGKSTLLKILSRVTEPTSGEIRIKGRIASLLEVGTGFHPELSGRENVYLNGAILGMSKAEVRRKFDEIAAFAEVDRFLDTPVKRYSSGMYVRLAFAVAAHLEPEILIVDEVLAVGDAQFQKKCLGKMRDVAGEGRTVLFVSHQMAAVATLCRRALLLQQGSIACDAPAADAIARYLDDQLRVMGRLQWKRGEEPSSKAIRFLGCFVQDEKREFVSLLELRQGFRIGLEYEVLAPIKDLRVGFDLYNGQGALVCGTNNTDLGYGKVTPPGFYTTVCRFPPHVLNENRYQVRFIADEGVEMILATELCLGFDVQDVFGLGPRGEKQHGIVRPKCEWEVHSDLTADAVPNRTARVGGR